MSSTSGASKGGLIQLVNKGSEDNYLYKNPSISFFKQSHLQYHPFSREQIEIIGTTNNNEYIFHINSIGDLLSNLYFHVQLPNITINDNTNNIISYTRSINDEIIKIKEQYGDILSDNTIALYNADIYMNNIITTSLYLIYSAPNTFTAIHYILPIYKLYEHYHTPNFVTHINNAYVNINDNNLQYLNIFAEEFNKNTFIYNSPGDITIPTQIYQFNPYLYYNITINSQLPIFGSNKLYIYEYHNTSYATLISIAYLHNISFNICKITTNNNAILQFNFVNFIISDELSQSIPLTYYNIINVTEIYNSAILLSNIQYCTDNNNMLITYLLQHITDNREIMTSYKYLQLLGLYIDNYIFDKEFVIVTNNISEWIWTPQHQLYLNYHYNEKIYDILYFNNYLSMDNFGIIKDIKFTLLNSYITITSLKGNIMTSEYIYNGVNATKIISITSNINIHIQSYDKINKIPNDTSYVFKQPYISHYKITFQSITQDKIIAYYDNTIIYLSQQLNNNKYLFMGKYYTPDFITSEYIGFNKNIIGYIGVFTDEKSIIYNITNEIAKFYDITMQITAAIPIYSDEIITFKTYNKSNISIISQSITYNTQVLKNIISSIYSITNYIIKPIILSGTSIIYTTNTYHTYKYDNILMNNNTLPINNLFKSKINTMNTSINQLSDTTYNSIANPNQLLGFIDFYSTLDGNNIQLVINSNLSFTWIGYLNVNDIIYIKQFNTITGQTKAVIKLNSVIYATNTIINGTLLSSIITIQYIITGNYIYSFDYSKNAQISNYNTIINHSATSQPLHNGIYVSNYIFRYDLYNWFINQQNITISDLYLWQGGNMVMISTITKINDVFNQEEYKITINSIDLWLIGISGVIYIRQINDKIRKISTMTVISSTQTLSSTTIIATVLYPNIYIDIFNQPSLILESYDSVMMANIYTINIITQFNIIIKINSNLLSWGSYISNLSILNIRETNIILSVIIINTIITDYYTIIYCQYNNGNQNISYDSVDATINDVDDIIMYNDIVPATIQSNNVSAELLIYNISDYNDILLDDNYNHIGKIISYKHISGQINITFEYNAISPTSICYIIRVVNNSTECYIVGKINIITITSPGIIICTPLPYIKRIEFYVKLLSTYYKVVKITKSKFLKLTMLTNLNLNNNDDIDIHIYNGYKISTLKVINVTGNIVTCYGELRQSYFILSDTLLTNFVNIANENNIDDINETTITLQTIPIWISSIGNYKLFTDYGKVIDITITSIGTNTLSYQYSLTSPQLLHIPQTKLTSFALNVSNVVENVYTSLYLHYQTYIYNVDKSYVYKDFVILRINTIPIFDVNNIVGYNNVAIDPIIDYLYVMGIYNDSGFYYIYCRNIGKYKNKISLYLHKFVIFINSTKYIIDTYNVGINITLNVIINTYDLPFIKQGTIIKLYSANYDDPYNISDIDYTSLTLWGYIYVDVYSNLLNQIIGHFITGFSIDNNMISYNPIINKYLEYDYRIKLRYDDETINITTLYPALTDKLYLISSIIHNKLQKTTSYGIEDNITQISLSINKQIDLFYNFYEYVFSTDRAEDIGYNYYNDLYMTLSKTPLLYYKHQSNYEQFNEHKINENMDYNLTNVIANNLAALNYYNDNKNALNIKNHTIPLTFNSTSLYSSLYSIIEDYFIEFIKTSFNYIIIVVNAANIAWDSYILNGDVLYISTNITSILSSVKVITYTRYTTYTKLICKLISPELSIQYIIVNNIIYKADGSIFNNAIYHVEFVYKFNDTYEMNDTQKFIIDMGLSDIFTNTNTINSYLQTIQNNYAIYRNKQILFNMIKMIFPDNGKQFIQLSNDIKTMEISGGNITGYVFYKGIMITNNEYDVLKPIIIAIESDIMGNLNVINAYYKIIPQLYFAAFRSYIGTIINPNPNLYLSNYTNIDLIDVSLIDDFIRTVVYNDIITIGTSIYDILYYKGCLITATEANYIFINNTLPISLSYYDITQNKIIRNGSSGYRYYKNIIVTDSEYNDLINDIIPQTINPISLQRKTDLPREFKYDGVNLIRVNVMYKLMGTYNSLVSKMGNIINFDNDDFKDLYDIFMNCHVIYDYKYILINDISDINFIKYNIIHNSYIIDYILSSQTNYIYTAITNGNIINDKNIIRVFNKNLANEITKQQENTIKLKQMTILVNETINRPNKPKIKYSDDVGIKLIDYCEFYIDDKVIERLDSDYIMIYNRLFTDMNKNRGVKNMINDYRNLYIPLYFWFCKGIGNNGDNQYLPLLALTKSKLFIKIVMKDIQHYINGYVDDGSMVINRKKLKIRGTLMTNVIYLSDQEKIYFAQNKHEYLIKTVNEYKCGMVTIGDNKINLNIKDAISELYFIIKNDIGKIMSDCINGMTINIDNYVREVTNDNNYYELVTKHKYYNNSDDDGIYVSSFSLYPYNISQPSGYFNMTNIENMTININMKINGELKVYYMSYKLLNIISGIGSVVIHR